MSRFFFGVMAGFLVIFFIPGCNRDNDQSGIHMQNARAFFAKQDYSQARASYRRALAATPDSVEAWSGLAQACMRLGDMAGATDAYQRIIDIDPDHIEALLRLARFDMLAGNTQSAEEKIRHVLEYAPENTEALFLMADLFNQTSRYGQAKEIYEQLLPLVSDKAEVLTGLARTQARLGDPVSALMNLEEAVAFAPEAMEPRLLLFNYYYGQNDYQNAENTLLQAITANPLNPTLHILLGQYYYSRNQTDDAEKAFLEAVRLDPDRETAYLIAGKFYNAADKPEAALKMFQKAAQLRPQDMKISTMLADFYLDNNFFPDARRTIADILDEHPGYFPARLLKIRLALAEKDYDQAILLCDTYLKSNPAADHLLVLKGSAHVAKGELKQAEQVLAEAVNVAPANINAKFRLLDVFLKQNKVEQAQQLNRDIFGYLHKNFDVTLVLGNTDLHKETSQKELDSLDSLSRFASADPFESFRTEHLNSLRAEYDRLMSEFNRILEIKPDSIGVFENVVLLHAARKEYDIALAKCDQQIERLKETPALAAEIHNIKGGLHLARNNFDQAKHNFKQAITLAPDFLKPYYGLAKIYIIRKDIDNAVLQYRALLSRDPQQPVPYMLLGVLYKMKGDSRAAEENYRKALAINPDFAQAANNLAYLLADQGKKLDEALTLALHAKKLKPDDPYILDTLGWVYYQQGAYDDAVRELSLSVDRLPEKATVNHHLGMAYYRKGDAGRAGQFLEKALQYGNGSLREADEIRRILLEIY